MANNTALVAGNQHQQQAVNKPAASGKHGNVLPLWGNEKTMNLNPMILTNVLSSPYFKVQLYELKTYHEVVDEIYFKVTHVEPWEKGSRKTAGQTGMCGGVRGVGTGGIVSTAFCLLYKLFTLKLTRKQVMGLITHTDSPYIRALGFMYIRYTQPPADLVDWFDDFLDDEEELDVKAGGGCVMTVGEMLRSFLTKLEWFSTLFPRIPVPVQKMIDQHMKSRPRKVPEPEESGEEPARPAQRSRSPRRTPSPRRSPRRSPQRSRSRDHHGSVSFDRELERERDRQRKEREGKDRDRRDRGEKERRRSRSVDRAPERRRSRSVDRAPERRRSRSVDRAAERRRSRSVDRALERRRSRSVDRAPERRRSSSRDKRNDRKERDGENDRGRRKDSDHSNKDKGSERERSKERRTRGDAVNRKEERRNREECKVRKSSQSREWKDKRSIKRSQAERSGERNHTKHKHRSLSAERRERIPGCKSISA